MEYERLRNVKFADNIGKRVFVTFMCKSVVTKLKKDNVTEYMKITMKDGDIEVSDATLFNLTDYHRSVIKEGYVFSAAVDVQPYAESKEGYSCKIYNINLISEDGTEFMEWSDGLDTAANNILSHIESIKETVYYKVAYPILISNWDKFVRYPAASSMHHKQLGGLCVHTSEVLDNAIMIGESARHIYGSNFVDMNLIIASAILHDVGKCNEFEVNMASGNASYAVLASLESHITNVITSIDEVCIKSGIGRWAVDFNTSLEEHKNDENIQLLKHCILAHHGKKEYGSPIEPSIPEAYILHEADSISAELNKFKSELNGMSGGTSKSYWASGKLYNVYKKSD